jgi:hypothetical protein
MTHIVDVQDKINKMLEEESRRPSTTPPEGYEFMNTKVKFKPLPNLVGIKINQEDLEAEIIGTYENPILKVTRVGPHECGSLGRYFFAGVEYPLETNEVDGYPLVYHVPEEWLKRGGNSCCPVYVNKDADGKLYVDVEIDS